MAHHEPSRRMSASWERWPCALQRSQARSGVILRPLSGLRAVLFAVIAITAAAAGAQTQTPSARAPPPPLPLFTIKSFMGRCLNMTPAQTEPAVTGTIEPALAIADCDQSANQQFGVEELDTAHHVRLHGGGACVEAASAAEGAAVSLQPCSASTGQVFDLDGDSIILDANPDLVVELKDSVTQGGTPAALGRRLTSDVELWDFISLDNPPRFPTSGFTTVTDKDGLVVAVALAQPNAVIELLSGTMIEFNDLPAPLAIPAGVTLRGDRRGVLLGPQVCLSNGHVSTGPNDDPGLFLMQASRTRITGLRIRGPGRDPNGTKPPMKGVNMETAAVLGTAFSELLDHNDISDWTISGVDLGTPFGDDDPTCPLVARSEPEPIHLFRNYIHDNLQDPKGGASDGYGLAAGKDSYPLVFANTFQKNVHSLTADGAAQSGYVAIGNLFMSGNASVDADVHGNGNANHDGGIAGMAAQLIGNTFLREDTGQNSANFSLRGLPCSGVPAVFRDNATLHSASDAITLIPADGGNGTNSVPWVQARPRVPYLQVRSKFSIPDPMQTFLVGDFDGDGKDDVFMATGAAWYYSPGGNAEWRFLSAKTETADMLLIGDFDGDGRADVFKQVGDNWYVSWGGRSDWKLLSTGHRVNMSTPDQGIAGFVIGDFVGDKRADVFFADGQNWWVSDGGVAPFQLYASSSFTKADLAFGDFDGSGKTEVAGVVDRQWMFVPANGPRQWTPLRPALTKTMNGVIAADFDGDGITDIAVPPDSSNNTTWEISLSGRGDLEKVRGFEALPNQIAVGRFDDRAGADLLQWQGNDWALTSYFVGSLQRQSRQDMR
jgi:hypothetical protein